MMQNRDATLSTQHLAVTVDDNVLVIRLNRPDKLNALTHPMLADLAAVIDSANDRGVDGIVLTGAGRAFSAGHDLSAENQASHIDEVEAAVETFHEVSRACLRAHVPTIAVINGIAVGGAFEMTLAFDRRIGTARSEVYMPENALGLVISNAASFLLTRLMGAPAALDFILASRRVDAAKAFELGLIDEMVDTDPIQMAIERIHEYHATGLATAQHLSLLRPCAQAVAAAMEKETAAAKAARSAGVTQNGISEFWNHEQ